MVQLASSAPGCGSRAGDIGARERGRTDRGHSPGRYVGLGPGGPGVPGAARSVVRCTGRLGRQRDGRAGCRRSAGAQLPGISEGASKAPVSASVTGDPSGPIDQPATAGRSRRWRRSSPLFRATRTREPRWHPDRDPPASRAPGPLPSQTPSSSAASALFARLHSPTGPRESAIAGRAAAPTRPRRPRGRRGPPSTDHLCLGYQDAARLGTTSRSHARLVLSRPHRSRCLPPAAGRCPRRRPETLERSSRRVALSRPPPTHAPLWPACVRRPLGPPAIQRFRAGGVLGVPPPSRPAVPRRGMRTAGSSRACPRLRRLARSHARGHAPSRPGPARRRSRPAAPRHQGGRNHHGQLCPHRGEVRPRPDAEPGPSGSRPSSARGSGYPAADRVVLDARRTGVAGEPLVARPPRARSGTPRAMAIPSTRSGRT